MTTAAGVREFGHHPAKSKKYGEKNQKHAAKISLAPIMGTQSSSSTL